MMDEALARSLNIPAMRVLAKVGPQALLDRLHEVGFSSLDQPASHYGLGLTLGDGEVTLVELAQAYAMFARGGMTCEATPFPGGGRGKRAFSPEVAWMITEILSDEAIRAAAFGPANALMMGYPVAVKTGTSSNWRDSWAVGYTPRYTISVWSGDYAGRPMNRLAGAAGAGPLFHRVVDRLVATDKPQPVPPPEDIVEVSVCALSGKIATSRCAHTRSVHVTRDHVPTESCDWHKDVAIDKRNGLLAGEHCPQRFIEHRVVEALPATYHDWLQTAPERTTAPRAYSPLCPRDGTIPDAVVVTYPREREVFVVEPGYDATTQTLAFTAQIDPPTDTPAWLVDGKPAGAVWQLERGTHQVVAVAGGRTSDPVRFEVR
jgi:penicillin-binding protein 1C